MYSRTSGSGKSTMLRCINLLEVPTSGEVYIDGELVTSKNINEIRTKMGMVFQNFNLFPHMTVLENVTCAPINVKGVSKADAEAKAMELLTRVGLDNKANGLSTFAIRRSAAACCDSQSSSYGS